LGIRSKDILYVMVIAEVIVVAKFSIGRLWRTLPDLFGYPNPDTRVWASFYTDIACVVYLQALTRWNIAEKAII
jgi:hypothetical protein